MKVCNYNHSSSDPIVHKFKQLWTQPLHCCASAAHRCRLICL